MFSLFVWYHIILLIGLEIRKEILCGTDFFLHHFKFFL